MSTNPARTFGPAVYGRYWHALWIYFAAPPLGMLLAAQAYLWIRDGKGPRCAKLHHHNDKRCIFCQSGPGLTATNKSKPTVHERFPNDSGWYRIDIVTRQGG